MREDYSNYLLGLVLIVCLLLLGVYGTRDHKPKTITKTEYIKVISMSIFNISLGNDSYIELFNFVAKICEIEVCEI